MLTKENARARIEQEIASLRADVEIVIDDDATLEYDWGWVFFYQSQEFLESGDHSYALAGNAPLIINKQSGEIVQTGTALPIEEYVRNYESQL